MPRNVFKKIRAVFSKRPSVIPQTIENTGYEEPYEHRYPPFPKGIPVATLDAVLDGQRELLQTIIAARGLSGDHNLPAAERQIIGAVRHFAELVHLLPASEKAHFRTPGGLFRFGLESGLHAIRYAERRILTRETPELRKETETLWTHAAFLAGLYSESIRVLSRLSVYSDDGLSWHPGADLLYPWLSGNKVKKYHLRWSLHEDRLMSAAVAGKTVPTSQAQILAKGEKAILSTLMSALYNLDDMSNPIVRIVQSVRYKLSERDLAADVSRYGKPAAGMHLEPWLIDAMRHLLGSRYWTVNAERSKVWHGRDGVYLIWPLSGADIQKELRESQCPFLPSDPSILAEILLDAGIIERNGPGYLFDIRIPQAESNDLKSFEALLLSRPEILFGAETPMPMDMVLGASDHEPEGVTVAAAVTETAVSSVSFGAVSGRYEHNAESYEYDDGFNAYLSQTAAKNNVSLVSAAQEKEKPAEQQPSTQKVAIEAEKSIEKHLMDSMSHDESVTAPDGPHTANQDQSVLEQLLQPSKIQTKCKQGSLPLPLQDDPEIRADHQKVRAQLLIEKLKRLPPDAYERQERGITKITNVNALKKLKLDVNDCVHVLKASDLLIPIDGNDMGVDTIGEKALRYLLIKTELKEA